MGFGSGYNTRYDRGGKRYSNSMVAHVWNSQSETRGQSGNGNFYLDGPALYSYGSHFMVAYIMPDGVALLNADSYSVSTSGHQSDAAAACRNRTRYYVPALTDLESALGALSRGFGSADAKRRHVANVREFLTANAVKLATYGRDSGRWRDEPAAADDSAGLYLATQFGLARSWPAIQKEAERRRIKAERETAKRNRETALRDATRLASYTDSEFRAALSRGLKAWGAHELTQLATAFHRARKFGKANGFSAKRLAILWTREKRTREVLADFSFRNGLAKKRENFARNVAEVRRHLKALEVTSGESSDELHRRSQAAGYLRTAAEALKDSPRFPAVTRFRLAGLAANAQREYDSAWAAYREAKEREYQEAERARAMKEAEYCQAWLAGEAVSGRRFDSEHGGAALRVRGDELQTSHGASVPLEHAVKAFRFIKLVRERGEGWQRNGKIVRVGHFQIDRIEPSGDFKAGCHDIRWQEVERVADALGLLDAAPSAEAEERSAA